MPADLHCHTKLSDSSMGIDDLIVLAQKKGITTIAITDRDCQAGTVRGKIIGERRGITVIPGVEPLMMPKEAEALIFSDIFATSPTDLRVFATETLFQERRQASSSP